MKISSGTTIFSIYRAQWLVCSIRVQNVPNWTSFAQPCKILAEAVCPTYIYEDFAPILDDPSY